MATNPGIDQNCEFMGQRHIRKRSPATRKLVHRASQARTLQTMVRAITDASSMPRPAGTRCLSLDLVYAHYSDVRTRYDTGTEPLHRQCGGKKIAAVKTTPCLTRSLRRWGLASSGGLASASRDLVLRCAPPHEFVALIEAVVSSEGINRDLRI